MLDGPLVLHILPMERVLCLTQMSLVVGRAFATVLTTVHFLKKLPLLRLQLFT